MYLRVEEETDSLRKEAIKIVFNLAEFTFDMQDVAVIEISKGFLLVRPHTPRLGFIKTKQQSSTATAM